MFNGFKFGERDGLRMTLTSAFRRKSIVRRVIRGCACIAKNAHVGGHLNSEVERVTARF